MSTNLVCLEQTAGTDDELSQNDRRPKLRRSRAHVTIACQSCKSRRRKVSKPCPSTASPVLRMPSVTKGTHAQSARRGTRFVTEASRQIRGAKATGMR